MFSNTYTYYYTRMYYITVYRQNSHLGVPRSEDGGVRLCFFPLCSSPLIHYESTHAPNAHLIPSATTKAI